jgi:predicted type IV restriction endonuclease/DNA-binding PadR family transcriptional regulator
MAKNEKFGPDDATQALANIIEEYNFLSNNQSPSEADTRSKIIDRVLREVLGWPERQISREVNTRGEVGKFLDYKFSLASATFIVVEAKAIHREFNIPNQRGRKRLKIRTLISTEGVVKDAIEQVRGYCDDLGCRYAIATNGNSWLVFRAIRENMNWRDGDARIFANLEDIRINFSDFWNLLSYEAVIDGRIEREFSEGAKYQRRQDRVLTRLYNADQPLERNRFHAQLDRFIEAFFKDIADQEYVQILEHCYVYSESLHSSYTGLRTRIESSMPRFLLSEGTIPVRTGKKHSGEFHEAISEKVEDRKGELVLVLGGIGAGKTTFLKRYLRLTDAEFLDRATVWFYVSFLGPPLDPQLLEEFIWNSVLDQLRSKYSALIVENRATLKKIYRRELDSLWETTFKGEGLSQEEVERRISPYLENWKNNVLDYGPRLLGVARERDRVPVICLDNVDQLPADLQASIFLAAQTAARKSNSVVILSLREETYYEARIRKTFTAYSNQKFHIASPNFLKLIGKRLKVARESLELPDKELCTALRSGIALDKTSLKSFLSIVEESVFKYSKLIVRFVQSVCHRDMRLALELFAQFLISGATDVDKMLRIAQRDGSYYVAFHEFLKSVMLGDRAYYREEDSPILNVFNAGIQRNSSHLTSLRVLRHLLIHRNEVTDEGRGFLFLPTVVALFDSIFDNRDDIINTLNRLVRKGLVESNTRSRESVEDAAYVRITAAGWYYIRYLISKFVYLDLVIVDTPIDDRSVSNNLFKMTIDIASFPDRDDNKLEKIEKRFSRVEQFLDYLDEQEKIEFSLSSKINDIPEISEKWIPDLKQQFDSEREWIRRRISENIERYQTDAHIFDVSALEEDTAFFSEE